MTKISYEIINKYITEKYPCKKNYYAKKIGVSESTINHSISEAKKDENGEIEISEKLYNKILSEMNISKDAFNNIFVIRYNKENDSIFKDILIRKLIFLSLSKEENSKLTIEDLLQNAIISKEMTVDETLKVLEKNKSTKITKKQLEKTSDNEFDNYLFDMFLDFDPEGFIEKNYIIENNIPIKIY